MRSSEQVVIISGAASGIGRELCRLFARRGASIGLIDCDKTKLEEFATISFGPERDVRRL